MAGLSTSGTQDKRAQWPGCRILCTGLAGCLQAAGSLDHIPGIGQEKRHIEYAVISTRNSVNGYNTMEAWDLGGGARQPAPVRSTAPRMSTAWSISRRTADSTSSCAAHTGVGHRALPWKHLPPHAWCQECRRRQTTQSQHACRQRMQAEQQGRSTCWPLGFLGLTLRPKPYLAALCAHSDQPPGPQRRPRRLQQRRLLFQVRRQPVRLTDGCVGAGRARWRSKESGSFTVSGESARGGGGLCCRSNRGQKTGTAIPSSPGVPCVKRAAQGCTRAEQDRRS